MVDDTDLFYVGSGVWATKLCISKAAVPVRNKDGQLRKRSYEGSLCNPNNTWYIRVTDSQMKELPLCEKCQTIFKEAEDNAG